MGDESPPRAGGGILDDPEYLQFTEMEIVDDEEIGDESPPQAGGGYRDDPWYLEFTEMVRKHREEEADRRQRGMSTWDDKIIRAASSDSEGMSDDFYDICLLGRLGLYCYNFQKIFL
ncbi:hypothetical protein AtNW77_Chr5g0125621 [Arabidopsis thaliana]